MREYNAQSSKQDSKRFNSQGRRNTLSIWVYNLSMVYTICLLLVYRRVKCVSSPETRHIYTVASAPFVILFWLLGQRTWQAMEHLCMWRPIKVKLDSNSNRSWLSNKSLWLLSGIDPRSWPCTLPRKVHRVWENRGKEAELGTRHNCRDNGTMFKSNTCCLMPHCFDRNFYSVPF